MADLDARKETILGLLIEDYILTVEPVGSQKLVDKYELDCSPATVRHELSALEDLGFLEQPHRSAGRVPTDRGYRYYVDNLQRRDGLAVHEKRDIEDFYAVGVGRSEDLFRRTSDLLSDLTSYLAVIFSPPLGGSRLKRFDLISLTPRTVLLVLITETGWVDKKVVEFDDLVDPIALQEVERVLNSKLTNLTLDVASDALMTLSFATDEQAELASMIFGATGVDRSGQRERVFWGGAVNILHQPEFGDSEKLQGVLGVVEESYGLFQLLRAVLEDDRVVVRIGAEMNTVELEDCSFVGSRYTAEGEILGALGLLGPTRMNYPRAISAVEYIAEHLSGRLGSPHID
ncbi:MAG: heat-inducible transcriptional repressor HrcA [Terriglobia bacterium]